MPMPFFFSYSNKFNLYDFTAGQLISGISKLIPDILESYLEKTQVEEKLIFKRVKGRYKNCDRNAQVAWKMEE